jgi:hypothetical protein
MGDRGGVVGLGGEAAEDPAIVGVFVADSLTATGRSRTWSSASRPVSCRRPAQPVAAGGSQDHGANFPPGLEANHRRSGIGAHRRHADRPHLTATQGRLSGRVRPQGSDKCRDGLCGWSDRMDVRQAREPETMSSASAIWLPSPIAARESHNLGAHLGHARPDSSGHEGITTDRCIAGVDLVKRCRPGAPTKAFLISHSRDHRVL